MKNIFDLFVEIREFVAMKLRDKQS